MHVCSQCLRTAVQVELNKIHDSSLHCSPDSSKRFEWIQQTRAPVILSDFIPILQQVSFFFFFQKSSSYRNKALTYHFILLPDFSFPSQEGRQWTKSEIKWILKPVAQHTNYWKCCGGSSQVVRAGTGTCALRKSDFSVFWTLSAYHLDLAQVT